MTLSGVFSFAVILCEELCRGYRCVGLYLYVVCVKCWQLLDVLHVLTHGIC